MPAGQQQNLKEFEPVLANLLQSITLHNPLCLHRDEKPHKWASEADLFTNWTKTTDFGCYFSWYVTSASFSHKNRLLPEMEPTTHMTGNICCIFASFQHWHGAICITFVLCWTTRVVCMLTLRAELSNLVACEVREMPLTLQSIECLQTGMPLHTCLFLYSEEDPRPSDRSHRGLWIQ